jgi:hypothetical protein
MTYTRRKQIIEQARRVECAAIDAGDRVVLGAAQRVIRALGDFDPAS